MDEGESDQVTLRTKSDRSSGIVHLLRENEAIFSSAAALIVIVLTAWAAVKFVFKAPELSIVVKQAEVRLPESLASELVAALKSQPPQRFSDSVTTALSNVASFLDEAKGFTKITFQNNSKKTLSNVDIRVSRVTDMQGFSVYGDILTVPELQSIVDRTSYDAGNNIVAVPTLPRFPPRTSFSVILWGDFSYFSLPLQNPIVATYDGGEGRIVQTREIQGLDVFVYDNTALLLIVILLVDIFLLLWAVERVGTELKSNQSKHD